MNDTPPPRAVLDSDVIFSRVLHELMGRVAVELGMLELIWSEQLVAEAKRKLMERKGLTSPAAQRWVDYLAESFPSGKVRIEEGLVAAELATLTADPEDRHVCALAIAGRADYLFTHDRGYLAAALRAHGIKVARPDEFLVDAWQEQPRALLETLELQTASWAGGQPLDELLDAIERAGARTFVAAVRDELPDR